MENKQISDIIYKFLNSAFKISLMYDLGGKKAVETTQIEEFLNSKNGVIELISSGSNLDNTNNSLIKFIYSSKIISDDELNFSTFINFEDARLVEILPNLDDLVVHKLKNKENYIFNEEILSLIDKNRNFENSYKVLLKAVKKIDEDLCFNIYNLIYEFSVLLSDHPSHFVISVKGDSSLPTSYELKTLIFDYQFAPNVHKNDLVSLIERYNKLIKGEGIISRIEAIRVNSKLSVESSKKIGLQ